LSIEFALGSGVNTSTANVSGVPVNVKLGTFYGVYLRPSLPLGDSAEIFARVGYLRGKSSVTLQGKTTEAIDSSFSYGAGIGVKVTEALSVGVDYMQYFNVDGVTVNGFGVGLRSDF
jgi:opacity protein-like surface antigen